MNMSYYPTGSVTSPVSVTGTGRSYTYTTSSFNGSSGASTVILNSNVTSANPSWNTTNFHNGSGETLMTIPQGGKEVVLEKAATLEVRGNLVMNGVDLDERLKTIEKVLQIPERDVIMESKHPRLKQLYEEYMHELEKYRTWHRIKGDEDATT